MDNSSSKDRDHAEAQDSFNRLLDWLDPDHENAYEQYEQIRQKLIQFFAWRRCFDAEELADETIYRTIQITSKTSANYIKDPARYVYGVAKIVFFEYLRQQKSEASLSSLKSDMDAAPDALDNIKKAESRDDCLEQCMQKYSPEERGILFQYYAIKKQGVAENRQQIAAKLGITREALNLRVYRIKAKLKKCIENCLQEIDDI